MNPRTGKFVRFSDNRIIIVPETMHHKWCENFKDGISTIFVGVPTNSVASAGFVHLPTGEAYGESESLSVGSKPNEDTQLLKQMLSNPMFLFAVGRFDIALSNFNLGGTFDVICSFNEHFSITDNNTDAVEKKKLEARLVIAYQMFD